MSKHRITFIVSSPHLQPSKASVVIEGPPLMRNEVIVSKARRYVVKGLTPSHRVQVKLDVVGIEKGVE